MKPQSLMVLAALAFALAACNSPAPEAQMVAPAAAPAPASVDVTPSDFKMPEGDGCVGDIARYRAITDNDRAMGHVAQSVYSQINKEITAADQQCADGHEAEARASIVASRKRHGYPTNL
jgi:hypothetical protein